MLFHIGLAVPDLEKGMAEFGALFDLEWRPVRVAKVTLVDSTGRRSEAEVHVTFSIPGPFAIELWEAIPDTPLAMPEAGPLHHMGYWVDDLAAESERLEALGYPKVVSAGAIPLFHQGPRGMLIEPEDVRVDIPSLRDLYPPGSAHAGEPVFSTS
jgi:hypothetical protein